LKPKKKKLIKIISIIVGVFLVIYLGISAYGAKTAMEIPHLPLTYSPDSLGVVYEDVSFYSRGDNVLLKGWYLPGEKKDVILFVHGGFQNRIDDNVDTGGLARALVGKGHDVLLFDLRGRGESEGKGQALSNIEEDIGGAVDYLKSRGFSTASICILGFCSGAASVCIYASQNSVGMVILDGCFIDCQTMVARQAKAVGAPEFLAYFFWPGGILFTHLLYGFKVVNPIDVIHDVNCPILFIHEEYDEYTTSEETQRLFQASSNPANEVWEVGFTEHSQGFRTHPAEYVERVDRFLKKVLNNQPAG
jgi:pimeloyl-ACP methyl ester carboxylesterase